MNSFDWNCAVTRIIKYDDVGDYVQSIYHTQLLESQSLQCRKNCPVIRANYLKTNILNSLILKNKNNINYYFTLINIF